MDTKIIERDLIKIILPISSEDDPHEFALIDGQGNQLFESMFKTYEYALARAKEEFPELKFTVKDRTQEWLIDLACRYAKDIKKLKPSLRKSGLTIDMSGLYYSRVPNSWGTCIPFFYNNKRYAYIEYAGGEFIREVK